MALSAGENVNHVVDTFQIGEFIFGPRMIAEFRPISIIHGAKFLRLVISAHMTSIDERAKDERRGIK